MPVFHVKGRLYPNGDPHAEAVEFQAHAESLDMFIEHLLWLGVSIQSSGFEDIRSVVAIVEQASWCTNIGADTYHGGSMIVRYCSFSDTDHEFEDSIRCSECQESFARPWEPFNYCPNCGAKVVKHD